MYQIIRRNAALLSVLTIAAAVVACGGIKTVRPATTEDTPAPEKPYENSRDIDEGLAIHHIEGATAVMVRPLAPRLEALERPRRVTPKAGKTIWRRQLMPEEDRAIWRGQRVGGRRCGLAAVVDLFPEA